MLADHNNKKSRRERPALDRHYGKIGIPAVAAALRCQNSTASESRSGRPPREPAAIEDHREREPEDIAA